ncbi:DUF5133 domain-containing protein [Streptomyces sp. Ru72]|uniref:DUF5133 domain-containing protein n=1 Tax=Streptomyces sp. Ru72 TaxID=2080747 RepID=UPI000CDD141C|nr:DUF5133 domain-containing protein [Streptomyces sp. Ru72]POX46429.1 DUF5133 domain-containing protein [Streptomyces sp. Ru72]
MLVPDPKAVRRLLTRYASLRIALAERETPEAVRELADVSYTLCVMTGTKDVRDAVAAADALLDGSAKPTPQQPQRSGITAPGPGHVPGAVIPDRASLRQ